MKAGLHRNLVGAIAVTCVAALPAVASATTAPISNLIVRPQGEFVELTVIGGGRVMCDNFTEPAEDGRPFRIVLDFCDADHALGQQTFDQLPMTQIQRIRTSQFATDPQRIVRIVLDMRSEVTFTTREEGSALVLRFVDPNRGQFAVWEANPNAAKSTLENATTALATTAPETAPNQSTSDAVHSEKPGAQSPVAAATTPAAPATIKTESKSPAVSHDEDTHRPVATAERAGTEPLSGHDRPKTQAKVVVAPPPAVAAKPETTPATETRNQTSAPTVSTPGPVAPRTSAGASPAPATSEKPLLAQSEMTAPPVTVTTPSAEPVTSANTSAEKTPVAKNEKFFTLPPVPLVFAPEYLSGEKPVIGETPSTTHDFAVSKESMTPIGPQAPTPGEQAATASGRTADKALWASTTVPNTNTGNARKPDMPAAAEAVSDPDVPPPSSTLLERLKTKFFGTQVAPRPYTTVDSDIYGTDAYGPPTPSNDLDREALLERIRQTEQKVAAGGSGQDATLDEQGVGGVSTREVLFYDDMGRRDPFAPLVTGLRSGFVTDQLPDIETLRLVGVLHDDVEALALLENVEGFSYIMRAGDRVQNGSLVAVQGNRALFRVDDYGWSHVVALQLTPRGADPSKALGLAPRAYPKHEEEEEGKSTPTDQETENKGSNDE